MNRIVAEITKDGVDAAVTEKLEEVANKLLKKGLDIDEVVELTKLSKDKVRELALS